MDPRVHRRPRRVAALGVDDLAELPRERIATVVGRYYAMDRDAALGTDTKRIRSRHESRGIIPPGAEPVAEVRRSYEEGVTDEFIEPAVIDGRPASTPQDAAIFFNFRPDRAGSSRSSCSRAVRPDDDDPLSRRPRLPGGVRRAGRPRDDRGGAGRARLRQLHVAETEKYAHVTYFFNGGRERRVGRGDPDPHALAATMSAPTTRSRRMSRRRGRRPACRGNRERLRLRRRELCEPGHGRTHRRRFPPSSARSRRSTAAWKRSSMRLREPAVLLVFCS